MPRRLGLVEFEFHGRKGQGLGNQFRFGPVVQASLRREAHESIGRGGPRFTAGTDLCREQDPGAAGHRDLLVLRAGARDVRNSMRVKGAARRTALRRGNALEGPNPMSDTDPRGRKAG